MRSHLTLLGKLLCLRARHRELADHYAAIGWLEHACVHRQAVVELERRIRARVTP